MEPIRIAVAYSQRQAAFLDYVDAHTEPNPLGTGESLVQHGAAVGAVALTFDIARRGAIKVQSLRAVTRGGGRLALATLCEWADANGITLTLCASPSWTEQGKRMLPNELVRWYQRFGFVPGKRHDNGTDMHRPPCTRS